MEDHLLLRWVQDWHSNY